MTVEKKSKLKAHEIINKMLDVESSLRWTFLGFGFHNIPVRFHTFFHRNKKCDPSEMVDRELQIYQSEPIEFLRSELKIYQSLLGGQSSLFSQLFLLLSFILSIIAIIFSFKIAITPNINLLISIFVIGIIGLIFLYLEIKGADLLAVREFHIRTIVLTVLIHQMEKRHILPIGG